MSLDSSNKRIEQIERTLKELLNWIKLANKSTLKNILIQELDSEEKKKVYELSDGYRSQYDIEAQTKVSRRMVGYYWQKWYGLGIVTTSEQRKGRMQKIAALDEVGIAVATQEREISVTEFRPRYLKNILANQKIFSDNNQLVDFAVDFLRLDRSSTYNLNKEGLIDLIISTFERSDLISMNSFMRALENRAKDKESDEFNKYFQAWEKQISK